MKYGSSTDWHELNAIIQDLRTCDADMWCHNAQRFTCGEAEALVPLIRLIHNDEAVEAFRTEHAEHDEEGDTHYGGWPSDD